MSRTTDRVIDHLNNIEEMRIHMLQEAKNHLPISSTDPNILRRFKLLNIRKELNELIQEAKETL